MTTPKRGTSIERDNPFRPGGDIEKEVADILEHSTISADTITIVDPSSPQYKKSNGVQQIDTLDSAECDNNEQVVVSVNDDIEQVVVSVNSQKLTDSNDNVREEKLTATTPETNGHTREESVNKDVLDSPNTKRKKDKKKKRTCQII